MIIKPSLISTIYLCLQIDRDHCTPNPCRNGGQCLNTPDDYYCQCSGDGWSWHGKNCTVPADAGSAAVSKASAESTTTMTSTTITRVTTMTPLTRSPSPQLSSQPPPLRSTTVGSSASNRRPGSGTTPWRQQQQRGDKDDSGNGECSATFFL